MIVKEPLFYNNFLYKRNFNDTAKGVHIFDKEIVFFVNTFDGHTSLLALVNANKVLSSRVDGGGNALNS